MNARLLAAFSCAAACAPAAREPDAGVEDAAIVVADAAPFDAPPISWPLRLSETGLYADLAAGTLAPGVVPYRVRYELWSDGAEKGRFLWLPDGAAIDTSLPDAWQFPVGTRVWKEFRVDGRRIETRYMEKRGPADWLRIAYVWRKDERDALAAPGGAVDALATTHDVPSTEDCNRCHMGGVDNLLGVSPYQIGAPDGDGTLDALVAAGRISDPPTAPYVVPGTAGERDALGYLHANCGHCHNDVSPFGALRPLRLFLPVGLTRPEDAPVYTTAIGARSQHVLGGTDTEIVPGDPDRSQLVYRMSTRNPYLQMPPLATEVVDDAGVATIRGWIDGLQ